MAKCDPWAYFSQCWSGEDVEARLRNQLEAHSARVRGAEAEIAALERDKLAAARSGNRAAARQCILERRKREALRNKYVQLRDFCETTLVRVTDVASITETVATLSAVRRTFGETKTDDLYEKLASSVQEISAANENVTDVHHLLSPRAADLPDEADLLAELDQLEAEVLAAAPGAPPAALAAPGQHPSPMEEVYRAMGVPLTAA
jgi:uncharacterized membrane protein YccC